MNHLVVSVSPDSSLDLLAKFADIILLDSDQLSLDLVRYNSLYIRSHFGQSETLPQKYTDQINTIVRSVRTANPDIKIIDGADSVAKIVEFEDKWRQYEKFDDLMPKTRLLDDVTDLTEFARPVFKKRLSSRGSGVTWDTANVLRPTADWIIQESLDIIEELRIYIINSEVYPIGAVRQSQTTTQNAHAISSRHLTQDEINFAMQVSSKAQGMDILGLDIARTRNGKLHLLEANRSPGFAVFEKLTGTNLASFLYV